MRRKLLLMLSGLLYVCLIASMNDMVVPSVSLEAKTLWLSHSLPITPWQALRAKMSVQLLLTVFPAFFCAAWVRSIVPAWYSLS